MNGVPTQEEVLEWRRRRNLRTGLIWCAGKLGEEAGEVLGAVIKRDEGRKTLADIAQETAQTVICCLGVAESAGFDLWAEVEREWNRVKDKPAKAERCHECGRTSESWEAERAFADWCDAVPGPQMTPLPFCGLCGRGFRTL